MKKYFILLTIMSVLFACSKYDDSELRGRIEKLETFCNQLNTNVTSLQTIVEALQSKDYVTSVIPVYEQENVIGYTINFEKSGAITIYHGKKGETGQTPSIGVKQDTDGIYYWTLDGEWMTDDRGKKIKAQGIDGQNGQDGTPGQDGKPGEDGQDGITPQFKIENNYWFISYNNGSTWQQLGKASGEDGIDGDSMFKDIIIEEDNVQFILSDGTNFTIPIHISLSIKFSIENILVVSPYENYSFNYEIIGGNENNTIRVVSNDNYRAIIEESDYSKGTVKVSTPHNIVSSELIFLISNNNDYVKMSSISLQPSNVVDLGLSVKWATHNIGANTPYEVGDYFAWGETKTKAEYTKENYEFYKNGNYVDIGNNISKTQYDAAYVNWGNGWRMPTNVEIQELIDNCNFERTIYNEVIGAKITGPNGNSIFLPHTGRYVGKLLDASSSGFYWGGNLYNDIIYSGFVMHVSGSSNGTQGDSREKGMPIRPVIDK